MNRLELRTPGCVARFADRPRKTAMPLVLDTIRKVVDGEVHLSSTDLRLETGSLTTLVGRTGAGKTTLLRLMAGLDRPTSGRVIEGGRDVTRVPVRRRNVAMVYQQFVNYPNHTVFDNIASPLKVRGVSRDEIARRVEDVAERLRISDCLDRRSTELSGGQQQRTALARALVKGADLLLLDEPLANLDYKLREELRSELRHVLSGSDAIVVYATADPDEALALGGDTVIVDEGRVLQQGPALEVWRRPATVRAARLVTDPPMNLVEGKIANGGLSLADGETGALPEHLAPLSDGRYIFGVRPSHLSARRSRPSDLVIRSRVELAEISGSETAIHFDYGDASWVSRQRGVQPRNLGDAVSFFVEPGRIFAFELEGGLIAAPRSSTRAAEA